MRPTSSRPPATRLGLGPGATKKNVSAAGARSVLIRRRLLSAWVLSASSAAVVAAEEADPFGAPVREASRLGVGRQRRRSAGGATNYRRRHIQLHIQHSDVRDEATMLPPRVVNDALEELTAQTDHAWREEEDFVFGRDLNYLFEQSVSMSMPVNPPTPFPSRIPTDRTDSPTTAPVGNDTTVAPTAPPFETDPTPQPSRSPEVSTAEPTRSEPATPRPTPTSTVSPGTPAPSSPRPSRAPTDDPVARPTESPGASPTPAPTRSPTGKPTPSPGPEPTREPSTPSPIPPPSDAPEASPTPDPATRSPTPIPTDKPTPNPTDKPTPNPTDEPATPNPTDDPTPNPTASPTESPVSPPPTPERACDMSPEERQEGIFDELSTATNPDVLNDPATPQGASYLWILNADGLVLCPDSPNLTQRYALAVLYYSTDGDGWIECFAGDPACGDMPESPFFGQTPYLAPITECDWAGSQCDPGTRSVMRAVRLGENGLGGTLPPEIVQLVDLREFNVEGNGIRGELPPNVGDGLADLRRLSLRENAFSGDIEALADLPDLRVLELQGNAFTGTIPSALGGSDSDLRDARFERNLLIGKMPSSICDNVEPLGTITTLTADCGGDDPPIECDCCTKCFD